MQLKFVIFGEIDNTIVLCCFVLFCSGIKGREFSSEIKKNVRISIKIGKKVDKSTHKIKTQKSNYKIVLDILSQFYNTKNDLKKAAEYDKKKAEVDKM